jgi:DNA-binding NtrC family response regulator
MELQILVVEDDTLLRKAIYDKLTSKGHKVLACETIGEASSHLDANGFELVFCDMRLPDGNGLDFLAKAKPEHPDTEFIIMTAFADVATAVEAIKRGAFDYLPKPFEDAQLEKIVRNVSDKHDLSSQISALTHLSSQDVPNLKLFGDMIGTAKLGLIFQTAEKIALSPDTTVLIMGESGTGKGMLAKAIHRTSPRASKPFVDINCSAIPAQLMESELFGYEKGAFTDAKNRKPGLLEVANGGTVFLDEIGDMELNLQGKLLKVLEDKEFRRLGSAKPVKIDVRIIAATNRDLKARVKEGLFREDLYYRLSVIPIILPPLREHSESIEPLAKYYFNYYNKQLGKKVSGFTDEAMNILKSYGWPGNVRELRNVIERSIILATNSTISADVLHMHGISSEILEVGNSLEGEAVSNASQSVSDNTHQSESAHFPVMSLAEAEKLLIQTVLQSVNGNKNKAAEILKIHRTTLYKKLEEYQLQ